MRRMKKHSMRNDLIEYFQKSEIYIYDQSNLTL